MSDIEMKQLEPRPFVGIRREVPTADLAAFYAEVFPKVMGWLAAKGIEPASMPISVWFAMDPETGLADCHAGCFVSRAMGGEGEITTGETRGGDVLTVTHTGPYDTVGASWRAIYARAAELGRAPGVGWEIYVDDPGHTPAERLRTEIHLPVS